MPIPEWITRWLQREDDEVLYTPQTNGFAEREEPANEVPTDEEAPLQPPEGAPLPSHPILRGF
jgi:hypothetical protein